MGGRKASTATVKPRRASTRVRQNVLRREEEEARRAEEESSEDEEEEEEEEMTSSNNASVDSDLSSSDESVHTSDDNRTSSTSRGRGRKAAKTSSSSRNNHEEEEESDNRLFCLCKQPYDARRFMVGCDSCDDWFHAGCLNMSEAQAEAIKDFMCPRCKQANKGEKRRRQDHSETTRNSSVSNKRRAYKQDSDEEWTSGGEEGHGDSGSHRYRANRQDDANDSDFNEDLYLTTDDELPPHDELERVIGPSERPGKEGTAVGQYMDHSYLRHPRADKKAAVFVASLTSSSSSSSSSSSYEPGASLQFMGSDLRDVDMQSVCDANDDFGIAFYQRHLTNPDISPLEKDRKLIIRLEQRLSELEVLVLRHVEQKRNVLDCAIAFALRRSYLRNLDEPLEPVLESGLLVSMDAEFKEKSSTAQTTWAVMLTCRGCLGLLPFKQFVAHVEQCSFRAIEHNGEVPLYHGLNGESKPLTVCGCPCGLSSFLEDVSQFDPTRTHTVTRVHASSSSSSSSSSSKQQDDGLKENMDTRELVEPTWEYCENSREDCLKHLGWDKLWSVELARNDFFLSRRIQLVRREIESIQLRMVERTDQEKNVNSRINAILNQSMVQPVTLSMSGNGNTVSKPPGTLVHARHGSGFGNQTADTQQQRSVYQNLSNVAWSHARYQEAFSIPDGHPHYVG